MRPHLAVDLDFTSHAERAVNQRRERNGLIGRFRFPFSDVNKTMKSFDLFQAYRIDNVETLTGRKRRISIGGLELNQTHEDISRNLKGVGLWERDTVNIIAVVTAVNCNLNQMDYINQYCLDDEN